MSITLNNAFEILASAGLAVLLLSGEGKYKIVRLVIGLGLALFAVIQTIRCLSVS